MQEEREMIDVQQLRKEAENGDAEAQFKLGALYYEGDIFTRDIEKGMFWLEKAAALYIGGMYWLEGDVVELGVELAYEFLVEASEAGYWLAEEVLEDWDEYAEIR